MTTQPGETSDGPPVGFDADIKPLFREKDRDAMRRAFDLWSYDDVTAHGDAIAKALTDEKMPCDGPWPSEHIALFTRWLGEGAAP